MLRPPDPEPGAGAVSILILIPSVTPIRCSTWSSSGRCPTGTRVARQVEQPTVVLGSTQRAEVVDATRAAERGVAVVRRRGGGGAVLLRPGDHLWIEAWIPRDDPLWQADVAVAGEWVGEWWGSALDLVAARVAAIGSSTVAEPSRGRTGAWSASRAADRESCSRPGARSWASPSGGAGRGPSSTPAPMPTGTRTADRPPHRR